MKNFSIIFIAAVFFTGCFASTQPEADPFPSMFKIPAIILNYKAVSTPKVHCIEYDILDKRLEYFHPSNMKALACCSISNPGCLTLTQLRAEQAEYVKQRRSSYVELLGTFGYGLNSEDIVLHVHGFGEVVIPQPSLIDIRHGF